MADDRVLVGINPATRKCEVISVNDAGGWKECRKHGLIAFLVEAEVARRLFGTVVPCLDALLPVADDVRVVFVHVRADHLGDNLFYGLVADALHKMADLHSDTGGSDEVRTGLWLNEGKERLHVATHWPLEDV